MSKLENDVVSLTFVLSLLRYLPQYNPWLNQVISYALNSYHMDITFVVKENPTHFLNTAFNCNRSSFTTHVCNISGKLPVDWSFKVQKYWKRNAIFTTLHIAKRISSERNMEIERIKIISFAGYPSCLVNRTTLNLIIHLSTHWSQNKSGSGNLSFGCAKKWSLLNMRRPSYWDHFPWPRYTDLQRRDTVYGH